MRCPAGDNGIQWCCRYDTGPDHYADTMGQRGGPASELLVQAAVR